MGDDFISFEDMHDLRPAERSNPHKRIAEEAQKIKYPCSACGGTGRYAGVRVRQQESHCFACGGKGYHLQSPEKRKAANAKRRQTMEAKRQAAITAFAEAHAELYGWMAANQTWNNFASSLLDQLGAGRTLSENQIAAMQRSMDKAEAAKAAKRAEREASLETVDVSAIERLFDTALENGLTKRAFRTDRLKITPAPAHGRNAGAIYVKDGGEYAGKIVAGKFHPTSDAAKDVAEKVRELAADPVGVARFYGRKTGICCCCGRELTDSVSIEKGIGPVCEANWFGS